MASTYSTNLAIELIGTGDQAGTWGITTNTNLGTLIEQAISGYVTQAVATGTDTTITIPNGATGVARNMYIELTGTGGASTNLIVPANKKLYFIFNNTASGQVTVKVSGQTGVSVPNGAKMILVSNGTDIVDATNYIGNISAASANITTLTGTNVTYTSGTISGFSSASANLTRAVIGSASVTGMAATSAVITTLTGTNVTYTSGTITTLKATSATLDNLSVTSYTVSGATITSANIATLTGTNVTYTSGTISGFNSTSASIARAVITSASITGAGISSAAITTLTATNATATTLSGTTLVYGSASITGATVTSAFIPTLTGTNANITSASVTTVTGTRVAYTSGTITSLAGTTLIYGSASLTGATVTSAFIPTLTATNATATTLSGTTLVYGSASISNATVTSAFIPTLTGTNAAITSATVTTASGTSVRYTSAQLTSLGGVSSAGITRLVATSSTITTIASTSATITSITTTNLRGVSSAGVTRLTATSASITGLSVTSAAIGKFTAGSSAVSNLFVSGSITSVGNIGILTGSVLGVDTIGEYTGAAIPLTVGTTGARNLVLRTNNTERVRIDAGGNFGLGVVPSAWSGSTAFQALRASVAGISNNAYLGANWYFDGALNRYIAAAAASRIDLASGGMQFQIAATGSAGGTISFTQAMTLTSAGTLLVGTTNGTPIASGVEGIAVGETTGLLVVNKSGSDALAVGRLTNDGDLVSFFQAGTKEGSISVSGNTISYNAFAGSHWSQLQDGSKPDILRGTVMESINELCEWPNEENERLPKCKISDTAGSKKVYGVFMAWDNDWTETNDMYVTAVGAFVCRVNAGVTVQEGDLLESNGDGTARVQADDIIRSSTIGKVTSTVKTHEYDDGSYCVPTVLYCG